ncbi:MAG: PAS domain-containing protein [Sphingomicrobium sp.]
MDSYNEHPSDFDLPSADVPVHDVALAIGTDERRMHVRAYNYWVSLLNGREFPSIEDLESGDVEDFSTNSVLLDFTCGRDNPAIPFVGTAIRDECGLDDDVRTIADVPSRSLLSRLTDHYLQIIANRAPIGFEAEYENVVGDSICYRGILMPFSSDGEQIDFIYGVINWKHVDSSVEDGVMASMPVVEFVQPDQEPEQAIEDAEAAESRESEDDAAPVIDEEPLELTEMIAPVQVEQEPVAEAEPEIEPEASTESAPVHFAWEDGPLNADEDGIEIPEIPLDENAGLADRLWAARETAESVKAGEGRTRAALYRALSLAYDFALAAQAVPDEYAELLEESGVKAQARAPMTPIVKLVFGIDYDKARLTEFAAALSFAQRQQVEHGAFEDFISKQPGGLKALVAAERQARRPEQKADTKTEAARERLRSVAPMTLADVPADEEFAVVVTRRGADGRHEPVAIVEDEALVDRAIRRVA